MKNRGFTLIEMIAVIAILGIVGVIASISFMSSIKDTKQRGCDEFVKRIEDAACVYASIAKNESCGRENCNITLETLIKEGYVKESADACTGRDLNTNSNISVTWDNVSGEKKCTYSGVKKYEG